MSEDDEKKLAHPAAAEPLDNPPKRHFARGLLAGLAGQGHDVRLGGTLALLEHHLSSRHLNRDPIEVQVRVPVGEGGVFDPNDQLLAAVDAVYHGYSASGAKVSFDGAPSNTRLYALKIEHENLPEPLFIQLRGVDTDEPPYMKEGFGPVISRDEAMRHIVTRVCEDSRGSVTPFLDLAHAYAYAQFNEVATLAGDHLSEQSRYDYRRALLDCANVSDTHLARCDPLADAAIVRATVETVALAVGVDQRLDANVARQRRNAVEPSSEDLAAVYDEMDARVTTYVWADYSSLMMMRETLRANVKSLVAEQKREANAVSSSHDAASNVDPAGSHVQELAKLLPGQSIKDICLQVASSYRDAADLHQRRVGDIQERIRDDTREMNAIAREIARRETIPENQLVLENSLRRGWQETRATGARQPTRGQVIPAAMAAAERRSNLRVDPGWAIQSLPNPLSTPRPPTQSY